MRSQNENLKKRDISIDVNQLINLDEKRRKAKFEAEQVRAEQNKLGKEIAKVDKNKKPSTAVRFESVSRRPISPVS